MFGTLVRSVGIGLLAAGLSSAIIKWSLKEHDRDVVKIRPSDENPLHFEFPKIMKTANRIDCLAIVNFAVLESLEQGKLDTLWQRILTGDTAVRILFLDPRSIYAKIRINELARGTGGDALSEVASLFFKRTQRSLSASKGLFGRLNAKETAKKTNKPPRFEIRVFDLAPNIWMYRIDDDIYWGITPAQCETLYARPLHVSREADEEFFAELVGHFQTIWELSIGQSENGSGCGGTLLKFYFTGEPPVWNGPLYDQLDEYSKSEIARAEAAHACNIS